jgi:hypothetical protein
MTLLSDSEVAAIKEASRHIPVEIKRQVRKECGFGCAVCGMPFFDYEHIIDFAKVKKHEAQNIVLLCPLHHASTTRKKLSKETVQEAKESPKNKSEQYSKKPFPLETSKNLKVMLASNEVIFEFPEGNGGHPIIKINSDNYFVVHAEDGRYTFSLGLTDGNGRLALNIDRGEVLVATDVFDYTYEADKLIVRAENGLLLDMTLSNDKVEIAHGAFLDGRGTGCIIQNGELQTYKNFNQTGRRAGGSYGVRYGGWRVTDLPNIDMSGSFAGSD